MTIRLSTMSKELSIRKQNEMSGNVVGVARYRAFFVLKMCYLFVYLFLFCFFLNLASTYQFHCKFSHKFLFCFLLNLASTYCFCKYFQNFHMNFFSRKEMITLADGCMSIIDYSLEPVYYDPQMIMHMVSNLLTKLQSSFADHVYLFTFGYIS